MSDICIICNLPAQEENACFLGWTADGKNQWEHNSCSTLTISQEKDDNASNVNGECFSLVYGYMLLFPIFILYVNAVI